MSRLKAPAYQWYPSDYLGCEHVQQMTLEAEGAYRRLLDHQWLNGSIPNDINALARICRNITPARMRKLWAMISPAFVPLDPDAGSTPAPAALVNRRMERMRIERIEFNRERSESGKKGGLSRAQLERNVRQLFGRHEPESSDLRQNGAKLSPSSAMAQPKPPSPSPSPSPSKSKSSYVEQSSTGAVNSADSLKAKAGIAGTVSTHPPVPSMSSRDGGISA